MGILYIKEYAVSAKEIITNNGLIDDLKSITHLLGSPITSLLKKSFFAFNNSTLAKTNLSKISGFVVANVDIVASGVSCLAFKNFFLMKSNAGGTTNPTTEAIKSIIIFVSSVLYLNKVYAVIL
jgi:hypothetical protein